MRARGAREPRVPGVLRDRVRARTRRQNAPSSRAAHRRGHAANGARAPGAARPCTTSRPGHRLRVDTTVGLVRRVLAQTRARVLQGDTHYPHKVLRLVEPHTEAIGKGKAAKPTKFGKMVKIQEAEAQFITDYTVCAARVPDGDLWMPSL